MPEGLQALIAFLLDAFQERECRPALRRCGVGEDLIAGLPSDTFAALVDAAAHSLHGHGYTRTHEFWERLRSLRPLRAYDVESLARAFGVELLPREPEDPALRSESIVLPASPSVPVPTLMPWFMEHRGTLMRLFIVWPLVVGVIAWFVAPAIDQALGPSGTRDPAEFAVCLTQACFATAVALCFGAWTDPNTHSHFSRSAVFASMWPDETEAGPKRDPAWRAALALPKDASLAALRDSTTRARNQFRDSVTWMFAAWAVLYVVLVGCWLAGFPKPDPLRSVVVRGFNDFASVAIFAGYWVLTRGLRDDRTDSVPDVWKVGLFGALIIALAHLIAMGLAGWRELGPEGQVIDFVFRFVSGCLAAAATGMFVGRLDSPVFRLPWWLLLIFCAYAGIQPSFSVTQFAKGNDVLTGAFGVLEFCLYAFAFMAKILLFIVLAWLYHSARLDFFLLRIRRLNERLPDDWGLITRAK